MKVSRHLARRHRLLRPLEDMEVSLVRASLESPGWLTTQAEARLRYALALARLTEVRTADGRDVDLTEEVAALRGRLTETLTPLLLDRRGLVSRPEVASLVPMIWEVARDHRDRLRERTKNHLDWEDVERELREKLLVVVCGGGGGVGYVYLGAFHALEERGLRPALLSGTSIGSILSAFRARSHRFDVTEVAEVVRDLSWGKLFRPTSLVSRYGLPAPLRLYLRAGVGRHFQNPDGEMLRMKDLDIPLLITIAGLRRGELPHEPQWYEHRFDDVDLGASSGFGITRTRRVAAGLWRTLSDFVGRPEMLKPLVVGGDPLTREFDVLDAVGFSSALPGLIHYDIAREDPRMESLLDDVLDREDLGRLLDGGLVDNVPARAAWRAVQNGLIGRRNALVVAFDAFAPRLTSPLWLPIQRLAQVTVRPNLRYAHVVKTFLRTLSPLELVPNVPQILKAVRQGREEFAYDLPLIERLLAPIGAVD